MLQTQFLKCKTFEMIDSNLLVIEYFFQHLQKIENKDKTKIYQEHVKQCAVPLSNFKRMSTFSHCCCLT